MLSAENLTKKYGNFVALNNLNISINAGEIYCLLGANGAGKSTTINLFLGFIQPTNGKLEINGLDISQKAIESKAFIAYIPENLTLYPTLSGLENLEYFAGLAKKQYTTKQLTDFLLEAGLQVDAHTKRAENYSKGMRQKVGIALALAKNATVLLLDEPTSGLDPQASNEFSNLLLKLKDKGVATLMATHDIFRVKQIATHIGIMKEGNLVKSFLASEVSLQELEAIYLEIING